MARDAYWISPAGKLSETGVNHITDIINHPAKFGLTRKLIDGLFKKHGEKLGREGKAREELIRHVIARGYLRVRSYGNRGYSVTVQRITRRVKDYLFDWAVMIRRGQLRGIDPHATVRIEPLAGGTPAITDIDGLIDYQYEARRQYLEFLPVSEWEDFDPLSAILRGSDPRTIIR